MRLFRRTPPEDTAAASSSSSAAAAAGASASAGGGSKVLGTMQDKPVAAVMSACGSSNKSPTPSKISKRSCCSGDEQDEAVQEMRALLKSLKEDMLPAIREVIFGWTDDAADEDSEDAMTMVDVILGEAKFLVRHLEMNRDWLARSHQIDFIDEVFTAIREYQDVVDNVETWKENQLMVKPVSRALASPLPPQKTQPTSSKKKKDLSNPSSVGSTPRAKAVNTGNTNYLSLDNSPDRRSRMADVGLGDPSQGSSSDPFRGYIRPGRMTGEEACFPLGTSSTELQMHSAVSTMNRPIATGGQRLSPSALGSEDRSMLAEVVPVPSNTSRVSSKASQRRYEQSGQSELDDQESRSEAFSGAVDFWEASRNIRSEGTSAVGSEASRSIRRERRTPVGSEASRTVRSERRSPVGTEVSRNVESERQTPVHSEVSRQRPSDRASPSGSEVSHAMMQSDRRTPVATEVSQPIRSERRSAVGSEASRSLRADQPTPVVTEASRPILSERRTPVATEVSRSIQSGNPTPVGTEASRPILSERRTPVATEVSRSIQSGNPTPVGTEASRPILSERRTPVSRPIQSGNPTPVGTEVSRKSDRRVSMAREEDHEALSQPPSEQPTPVASRVSQKSKSEKRTPVASEASQKSKSEKRTPVASEASIQTKSEKCTPVASEASHQSKSEKRTPVASEVSHKSRSDKRSPVASEVSRTSKTEKRTPVVSQADSSPGGRSGIFRDQAALLPEALWPVVSGTAPVQSVGTSRSIKTDRNDDDEATYALDRLSIDDPPLVSEVLASPSTGPAGGIFVERATPPQQPSSPVPRYLDSEEPSAVGSEVASSPGGRSAKFRDHAAFEPDVPWPVPSGTAMSQSVATVDEEDEDEVDVVDVDEVRTSLTSVRKASSPTVEAPAASSRPTTLTHHYHIGDDLASRTESEAASSPVKSFTQVRDPNLLLRPSPEPIPTGTSISQASVSIDAEEEEAAPPRRAIFQPPSAEAIGNIGADSEESGSEAESNQIRESAGPRPVTSAPEDSPIPTGTDIVTEESGLDDDPVSMVKEACRPPTQKSEVQSPYREAPAPVVGGIFGAAASSFLGREASSSGGGLFGARSFLDKEAPKPSESSLFGGKNLFKAEEETATPPAAPTEAAGSSLFGTTGLFGKESAAPSAVAAPATFEQSGSSLFGGKTLFGKEESARPLNPPPLPLPSDSEDSDSNSDASPMRTLPAAPAPGSSLLTAPAHPHPVGSTTSMTSTVRADGGMRQVQDVHMDFGMPIQPVDTQSSSISQNEDMPTAQVRQARPVISSSESVSEVAGSNRVASDVEEEAPASVSPSVRSSQPINSRISDVPLGGSGSADAGIVKREETSEDDEDDDEVKQECEEEKDESQVAKGDDDGDEDEEEDDEEEQESEDDESEEDVSQDSPESSEVAYRQRAAQAPPPSIFLIPPPSAPEAVISSSSRASQVDDGERESDRPTDSERALPNQSPLAAPAAPLSEQSSIRSPISTSQSELGKSKTPIPSSHSDAGKSQTPVHSSRSNVKKSPDPVRSSQSSVGKVPDPVRSSQSSVAKLPDPVRSSQSSVGKSPDPVQSSQSSVGKLPDPVRSSQSSVGKFPDPVRSSQSSVGKSPKPVQSSQSSVGKSPKPVRSSQSNIGKSPTPVRSSHSDVGKSLGQLPAAVVSGVSSIGREEASSPTLLTSETTKKQQDATTYLHSPLRASDSLQKSLFSAAREETESLSEATPKRFDVADARRISPAKAEALHLTDNQSECRSESPVKSERTLPNRASPIKASPLPSHTGSAAPILSQASYPPLEATAFDEQDVRLPSQRSLEAAAASAPQHKSYIPSSEGSQMYSAAESRADSEAGTSPTFRSAQSREYNAQLSDAGWPVSSGRSAVSQGAVAIEDSEDEAAATLENLQIFEPPALPTLEAFPNPVVAPSPSSPASEVALSPAKRSAIPSGTSVRNETPVLSGSQVQAPATESSVEFGENSKKEAVISEGARPTYRAEPSRNAPPLLMSELVQPVPTGSQSSDHSMSLGGADRPKEAVHSRGDRSSVESGYSRNEMPETMHESARPVPTGSEMSESSMTLGRDDRQREAVVSQGGRSSVRSSPSLRSAPQLMPESARPVPTGSEMSEGSITLAADDRQREAVHTSGGITSVRSETSRSAPAQTTHEDVATPVPTGSRASEAVISTGGRSSVPSGADRTSAPLRIPEVVRPVPTGSDATESSVPIGGDDAEEEAGVRMESPRAFAASPTHQMAPPSHSFLENLLPGRGQASQQPPSESKSPTESEASSSSSDEMVPPRNNFLESTPPNQAEASRPVPPESKSHTESEAESSPGGRSTKFRDQDAYAADADAPWPVASGQTERSHITQSEGGFEKDEGKTTQEVGARLEQVLREESPVTAEAPAASSSTIHPTAVETSGSAEEKANVPTERCSIVSEAESSIGGRSRKFRDHAAFGSDAPWPVPSGAGTSLSAATVQDDDDDVDDKAAANLRNLLTLDASADAAAPSGLFGSSFMGRQGLHAGAASSSAALPASSVGRRGLQERIDNASSDEEEDLGASPMRTLPAVRAEPPVHLLAPQPPIGTTTSMTTTIQGTIVGRQIDTEAMDIGEAEPVVTSTSMNLSDQELASALHRQAFHSAQGSCAASVEPVSAVESAQSSDSSVPTNPQQLEESAVPTNPQPAAERTIAPECSAPSPQATVTERDCEESMMMADEEEEEIEQDVEEEGSESGSESQSESELESQEPTASPPRSFMTSLTADHRPTTDPNVEETPLVRPSEVLRQQRERALAEAQAKAAAEAKAAAAAEAAAAQAAAEAAAAAAAAAAEEEEAAAVAAAIQASTGGGGGAEAAVSVASPTPLTSEDEGMSESEGSEDEDEEVEPVQTGRNVPQAKEATESPQQDTMHSGRSVPQVQESMGSPQKQVQESMDSPHKDAYEDSEPSPLRTLPAGGSHQLSSSPLRPPVGSTTSMTTTVRCGVDPTAEAHCNNDDADALEELEAVASATSWALSEDVSSPVQRQAQQGLAKSPKVTPAFPELSEESEGFLEESPQQLNTLAPDLPTFSSRQFPMFKRAYGAEDEELVPQRANQSIEEEAAASMSKDKNKPLPELPTRAREMKRTPVYSTVVPIQKVPVATTPARYSTILDQAVERPPAYLQEAPRVEETCRERVQEQEPLASARQSLPPLELGRPAPTSPPRQGPGLQQSAATTVAAAAAIEESPQRTQREAAPVSSPEVAVAPIQRTPEESSAQFEVVSDAADYRLRRHSLGAYDLSSADKPKPSPWPVQGRRSLSPTRPQESGEWGSPSVTSPDSVVKADAGYDYRAGAEVQGVPDSPLRVKEQVAKIERKTLSEDPRNASSLPKPSPNRSPSQQSSCAAAAQTSPQKEVTEATPTLTYPLELERRSLEAACEEAAEPPAVKVEPKAFSAAVKVEINEVLKSAFNVVVETVVSFNRPCDRERETPSAAAAPALRQVTNAAASSPNPSSAPAQGSPDVGGQIPIRVTVSPSTDRTASTSAVSSPNPSTVPAQASHSATSSPLLSSAPAAQARVSTQGQIPIRVKVNPPKEQTVQQVVSAAWDWLARKEQSLTRKLDEASMLTNCCQVPPVDRSYEHVVEVNPVMQRRTVNHMPELIDVQDARRMALQGFLPGESDGDKRRSTSCSTEASSVLPCLLRSGAQVEGGKPGSSLDGAMGGQRHHYQHASASAGASRSTGGGGRSSFERYTEEDWRMSSSHARGSDDCSLSISATSDSPCASVGTSDAQPSHR